MGFVGVVPAADHLLNKVVESLRFHLNVGGDLVAPNQVSQSDVPTAAHGSNHARTGHAVTTDISGVDNFIEEGNPLEPKDIAEVEGN
jgi:hypothetical protein